MNVSTSTSVVFTFNTAMDPNATGATFLDSSFNSVLTMPSWSAGNTVLTCTPVTSFPANKTITWYLAGQSADGTPLPGLETGTFSTGGSGGGGGGGGTGTNAVTGFSLGKIHVYHQTSGGSPTLDTNNPYIFDAVTTLSSNRTATSITLTLPSSDVSPLMQSIVRPESFTLFDYYTNLTDFDNTYGSGDYVFDVQAASSNQMVTVNFPSSMQQPAAPHLTNYTAAQAVDASKSFTLAWDAFPGGTASDYVHVQVGDVFSSPDVGKASGLPGTATSFTIPAGTLQPNMSYDTTVAFYHWVVTTNGSNYFTSVFRATSTEFSLNTSSGMVSGPLVLTNAAFSAGSFSFNVQSSVGQTVTVEYRTNLTAGSWQPLFTTNTTGTSFKVSAPQGINSRSIFFRARNGL